MSGIEIDQACVDIFQEIKIGKKHRFVTFKIEGKKKVVIDVVGERGQYTKHSVVMSDDCFKLKMIFLYLTN